MGAFSKYTDELADQIADLISDGNSMRQIAKMNGMPDKATLFRWMADNPAFATKCARARELQADFMDDEIMEVVNETRRGTLDPAAARVVLSGLQWRASKLAPKKYGERIELAGEVKTDNTIHITREVIAKPTA